MFICWSDGLETAERTEYNVTSDIELTAYFGHSVEYKVNNGVGGSIKGKAEQSARIDANYEEVEAIPDEGYAFAGWSDLQTESKRIDKAERDWEHIAYFEPIKRTFALDYGIADGIPLERGVTIDRNDIRLDGYPTPTVDGYSFEGWYADKDYKLKAINADGRYMLGYYGFSVDTDTLYARWKPVEANDRVFKILFVFVNEVKAKLYPAHFDGDGLLHDVYHLMTALDREYCVVTHGLFLRYISEWLSSVTTVEVDAYFTTQTVTEECIHYIPGQSDQYSLLTSELPELNGLCLSYHSIQSVFGINNYDRTMAILNIAGSAGLKYANIHLEQFYYSFMINHEPLEQKLTEIKTDETAALEHIDTCIHEFIHACEQAYPEKEIISYHKMLSVYMAMWQHKVITRKERSEINRKYLLDELEYDGKKCGIPKSFWTEGPYKLAELTWYERRPILSIK